MWPLFPFTFSKKKTPGKNLQLNESTLWFLQVGKTDLPKKHELFEILAILINVYNQCLTDWGKFLFIMIYWKCLFLSCFYMLLGYVVLKCGRLKEKWGDSHTERQLWSFDAWVDAWEWRGEGSIFKCHHWLVFAAAAAADARCGYPLKPFPSEVKCGFKTGLITSKSLQNVAYRTPRATSQGINHIRPLESVFTGSSLVIRNTNILLTIFLH